MSILEIPETSPGRVRVIVRHLVAIESQRQRAELLEALLSPASLPVRRTESDDDDEDSGEGRDQSRTSPTMFSKVIAACEKLGLLVRDEADVVLSPDLPREARNPSTADARLPLTLAELIFSRANPVNHDVGRLIAWYLMQDPLDPPSNERGVQEALARTPALSERFGLRNVGYGQFEDWVCFLGFGWGTVSPDQKRAITPDPTAYLRRVVDSVFEAANAPVLSLGALSERIAEACPVLEGGFLRREVEELSGVRSEMNALSLSTSQAWFRLEKEGLVELVRKADAVNPVVLSDDTEPVKVAEIRRLNGASPSHRRK
jgi:hypothetical protein